MTVQIVISLYGSVPFDPCHTIHQTKFEKLKGKCFPEQHVEKNLKPQMSELQFLKTLIFPRAL